MTMYRRLLKVRTVGSRAEGNLRPAFSDNFANKYVGINYVVHEYNEREGWCIVEAWCSDHPVLPPEHRKDMRHLEELARDPNVIEVVPSHPLSPPVLGRITVSVPDSVVEATGEVVVLGRRGKFIRKEKEMAQDIYILDEG
jgi:hypothetical protein